jgi:hypothetical protein
MNMHKWLLAAIISFGLILCAGCKKQATEWKGTIEKKDGTTFVNNPKYPIYDDPVLVLKEDLVIRGSEDIEEQMFQSINILDVDEQGQFYILDEQAGNIKVFDQNGEFVRAIGRKGQGPGEFGLPISLFISPQDQIIVNDMGQRKIHYFDKEGNYLKEFSIADKFLFFGPMVTSKGDLIVMYTIPQEKPVTVLQKLNPKLDPVFTFTSIFLDTPPTINIFVARSLTSLRWTMTYDEKIIWADIKNPEYSLHFHAPDGNWVRTITREYDPIAITTEDQKKLIDTTFGNNPTEQWDIQFPDHYPPFSGFSFDDLGHLFVRRYEKVSSDDGYLYDIFDSEGKYIAQMRFKMNPMIWKKGVMYTIEEDAEGFKIVKRYKVQWKI